MNTNGTLISFIGSRGSGKTTIADAVHAEFVKRGRTTLRQHMGLARRPLLRALVNAVYLWRFFDWEIIQMLGFCGRSRRGWPSLYRIYMPLAFAHDLRQLATKQVDVLVYDSNVLRGLSAAVDRGDLDLEMVADFYQRKVLSRTARVIFAVVDTNPVQAVDRWIARDNVHLSETERTAAITERGDTMRSAGRVIGRLAKLPNVTVVRLDGNVDPVGNAERVVERTLAMGSEEEEQE